MMMPRLIMFILSIVEPKTLKFKRLTQSVFVETVDALIMSALRISRPTSLRLITCALSIPIYTIFVDITHVLRMSMPTALTLNTLFSKIEMEIFGPVLISIVVILHVKPALHLEFIVVALRDHEVSSK